MGLRTLRVGAAECRIGAAPLIRAAHAVDARSRPGFSPRLLFAIIALLSVLHAGTTVAQTIDGGHSHTIVATPDGRVFTWGYNASGQLGDGTTTQRPLPTEIVGLTGAVGVAGGLSHTLVLKSDGTIWAFGANTYGQLGDATLWRRIPRPAPEGLPRRARQRRRRTELMKLDRWHFGGHRCSRVGVRLLQLRTEGWPSLFAQVCTGVRSSPTSAW
jgi:hypothetical protein